MATVLKTLSDRYVFSTVSPNTLTVYDNYKSGASGKVILSDVSNISNYPLTTVVNPLVIKDLKQFSFNQLSCTACCSGDIILTDADNNKFVFKDFEEWDDVTLDYFNESDSAIINFNHSPISYYQKDSYIYIVFGIKDIAGIDRTKITLSNNHSGKYAVGSFSVADIALFGLKIYTSDYDDLEITINYGTLSEVLYSGLSCSAGWNLTFSDRSGGFPTYPITTKVKESVSIENSQYSLPSLSGTDNRVGGSIDSTRKWSFHTGWLTKEVSDYLYYNLICSDYLLLRTGSGEEVRVKIGLSEVNKKDFDADGLRFYNITLEEIKTN